MKCIYLCVKNCQVVSWCAGTIKDHLHVGLTDACHLSQSRPVFDFLVLYIVADVPGSYLESVFVSFRLGLTPQTAHREGKCIGNGRVKRQSGRPYMTAGDSPDPPSCHQLRQSGSAPFFSANKLEFCPIHCADCTNRCVHVHSRRTRC